jgi:LmbE family N-acetylglucosaminyl deacetylase
MLGLAVPDRRDRALQMLVIGAHADDRELFEGLKSNVIPDVVLPHRREDADQDHRLVPELTWNTFRDHLILEYEIPKYDGDLGRPNRFVPLPAEVCERKIELLLEGFPSQRERRWFSVDTFWAILPARDRVGLAHPLRRRFHCRKAVLSQ